MDSQRLRDGDRELPGTKLVIECTFFGDVARFHHVGLAVQSIREASPDSEVVVNRTEGVSMSFLSVHGLRIELLEPLGDSSPIARSIRAGTKLLHLCYEVPQLEQALERCRPEGFHVIGKPRSVPEFGNRRIAWVFHNRFGLFELLEEERH